MISAPPPPESLTAKPPNISRPRHTAPSGGVTRTRLPRPGSITSGKLAPTGPILMVLGIPIGTKTPSTTSYFLQPTTRICSAMSNRQKKLFYPRCYLCNGDIVIESEAGKVSDELICVRCLVACYVEYKRVVEGEVKDRRGGWRQLGMYDS